MTFEESLAKNSEIPPEHYRVVAPTDFEIKKIQCAIVFTHGAWSAFSIIAWKALTRFIDTLGAVRNFEMLVLNLDRLDPAKAEQEFGEVPQGNGETFWVKNGRLVHRLSKFSERDTERLRAFSASLGA